MASQQKQMKAPHARRSSSKVELKHSEAHSLELLVKPGKDWQPLNIEKKTSTRIENIGSVSKHIGRGGGLTE